MKKVVITKELIANYPYKNSKWSPHRPWCRLCSIPQSPGREQLFRVLEVDEEAIEVHFRNGTVAYYHVSCWDNPGNKEKVESIKKQEACETREKVQPTTKAIVTPE